MPGLSKNPTFAENVWCVSRYILAPDADLDLDTFWEYIAGNPVEGDCDFGTKPIGFAAGKPITDSRAKPISDSV